LYTPREAGRHTRVYTTVVHTGRHTRVYTTVSHTQGGIPGCIPLFLTHREAYPGVYTFQTHREAYPGGVYPSDTQGGIPGWYIPLSYTGRHTQGGIYLSYTPSGNTLGNQHFLLKTCQEANPEDHRSGHQEG